jgi:hypothetical protein
MRKKIFCEIWDEFLAIIISSLILLYNIIGLIHPPWFFNKYMQRTSKPFSWLTTKLAKLFICDWYYNSEDDKN